MFAVLADVFEQQPDVVAVEHEFEELCAPRPWRPRRASASMYQKGQMFDAVVGVPKSSAAA